MDNPAPEVGQSVAA
jgi:hypothetical protein